MSNNQLQPYRQCTGDSATNQTVRPAQCNDLTSLNSKNPFLVTPTNPCLSSTNQFLVPIENNVVNNNNNNNNNPFLSNVATGSINVNHTSYVFDAKRAIDRVY